MTSESGAFAVVTARSGRDLLSALLEGEHLMAVVPITLAIVEQDPLASAGCFRGDLMRGLMEISGNFWGRRPQLYDRYIAALRASASQRRALPRDQRMEFWSPLDLETVARRIPDA